MHACADINSTGSLSELPRRWFESSRWSQSVDVLRVTRPRDRHRTLRSFIYVCKTRRIPIDAVKVLLVPSVYECRMCIYRSMSRAKSRGMLVNLRFIPAGRDPYNIVVI